MKNQSDKLTSYENLNFTIDIPKQEEYEDCKFVHCNFTEADLSRITFTDCAFISCELSMIKTEDTTFRNVQFKECKMLGIHFENSNTLIFFIDFKHCLLNFSCFFKLPLKKFKFEYCSMVEVDFTESDLGSATFDHCDLSGAIFDNTILEKTDFRTASHYHLDPEINKIKGAKFSSAGLEGLLNKYQLDIE